MRDDRLQNASSVLPEGFPVEVEVNDKSRSSLETVAKVRSICAPRLGADRRPGDLHPPSSARSLCSRAVATGMRASDRKLCTGCVFESLLSIGPERSCPGLVAWTHSKREVRAYAVRSILSVSSWGRFLRFPLNKMLLTASSSVPPNALWFMQTPDSRRRKTYYVWTGKKGDGPTRPWENLRESDDLRTQDFMGRRAMRRDSPEGSK